MIYKALQAPNRGRWYKVSPAPENGLLTVHKTRYDTHDLHSPAGTGVQLHPAPEFPLWSPYLQAPVQRGKGSVRLYPAPDRVIPQKWVGG